MNNVAKTVVVANPYAAVTTDAGSRSAMFLSVLTVGLDPQVNLAKHPATLSSTLRLMSHWHEVHVLILLDAETTAACKATGSTDELDRVQKQVSFILSTAQANHTIQVVPFVAAKTAEQLIIHECEESKVDFLVLDRTEDLHLDCLRNGRATTILVGGDS